MKKIDILKEALLDSFPEAVAVNWLKLLKKNLASIGDNLSIRKSETCRGLDRLPSLTISNKGITMKVLVGRKPIGRDSDYDGVHYYKLYREFQPSGKADFSEELYVGIAFQETTANKSSSQGGYNRNWPMIDPVIKMDNNAVRKVAGYVFGIIKSIESWQ